MYDRLKMLLQTNITHLSDLYSPVYSDDYIGRSDYTVAEFGDCRQIRRQIVALGSATIVASVDRAYQKSAKL